MRKIITTLWLVSALAIGAIAAAPTLAADFKTSTSSDSMMDSGMMSGMAGMKGGMSDMATMMSQMNKMMALCIKMMEGATGAPGAAHHQHMQ